jgi:predicted nucleic acid binding AN1-type Zn finger protein
VRSVLWSLGYYGSTNEGMKTIVKEALADSILSLSVHSPTLSLRGTCRYVLNMFCHSEEGRNYLARNGLTVNKKLLSCAPNTMQKPYQLNDNPELHLSQNRQFWKEYSQNLCPLNESKSFLM